MRRKNNFVAYILGIMLFLFFILAVTNRLAGLGTGETRDGKTESELNLSSGDKEGQQGKISNDKIRVLLMTTGYTDIHHSLVRLSAEGGLKLTMGAQTEEEETEIWSQGSLNLEPDDARFSMGKLLVEPVEEEGEIRVESIERGAGIPSYDGVLEIWSKEEGMAVINELPLEDYLCKVVPSEMPASYQPEALKAQAVCARSYGARQMSGMAYPEYQANVNDSTDFQVYNNSPAAEAATQAVRQTAGQVVWYGDTIATTYYYSTSCGVTTDVEAWGTASGEGNGYLQSVSVSDGETDYEKDLPWYHWTAKISEEVLRQLLEDYAGQDLGTLEQVEVTRRGPGDVAVELTVVGSNKTLKVETENKIRTALGGAGYQLIQNDGTVVDSRALLPSAFFTIKKEKDNYVLEGGGFGHGIGMSQNGANEMAKDGKSYREILEMFYPGTQVQ